jgi:ABC-type bacteriocin/lantibiotic exporter with double-glycine peptidase domain
MSKKKVSFGWAFKEFIWPRRGIVSLGLILILLRSLSGLVLPYSSKFLLDDIIPQKDQQALTLLLVIVVASIIVQASSEETTDLTRQFL